ncbi:MAG: 5-formyltetrahydrofolate cyclo-ligase [Thermoproteus sp.]
MRDPLVLRRKREIRERIWDLLERSGVAAFPRPVHGRIPNFVGAESACRKLRESGEWASARVVKINPDAPQRPCREAALAEGKVVVMPTPRIREGFLLLDPRAVPRGAYREASTISGAFRWGVKINPREMPQIDLVVIGSVAVNPGDGARLGKSHGYAELEWGIATALGKASESTPVATTVHELQLVDDDIPQEPFDLPVDLIATQTRALRPARRRQKPRGILWEYITEEMLSEIPLLSSLR